MREGSQGRRRGGVREREAESGRGREGKEEKREKEVILEN